MKLIILDFTVGEVYVYSYDANELDPEEVVDEDGVYVLNNNCEYMIVDELKINIK
jgi:hypothetical protein